MKSRAWKWIIAGCIAIVASLLGMRCIVGRTIARIHTEFLLEQLDSMHESHLRAGGTPVTSERELNALVSTWQIDWNSCEFQNGITCDSWGTPIRVLKQPDKLELRSAGPDRKFGTADDLVRAEPVSGQKQGAVP